jgi:hypothetical protein
VAGKLRRRRQYNDDEVQRPMTSPQQPVERPNGSFVKHTTTGNAGRLAVSILVREDDPRNPDDPHRWRPVQGNSRWLTWQEALATGTVEPLFTTAEVAASGHQHPPSITQGPAAPPSRDDPYSWPAARRWWDADLAARPEPGHEAGPVPAARPAAAAREQAGPRR